MSAKSLTVVALFKAGPGNEAKVRQALSALLVPTRGEKGCLNYDLHLSETDPALFMFHENWISKDHLERHLQSKHVQKALEVVIPLLANPAQITLWEKLG
jgi:quinol monooxygenase YgiN